MLGFWLIITFMFVGNLGWWRWADRALRPLRGSPGWRLLLAAFIMSQLAYLVFFFVAPALARRSHEFLPSSFLGVFYLWCLIVLPIAILLTALLNGSLWFLPTRSSSKSERLQAAPPEPVRQGEPTPISHHPLSRRQLLMAAAVATPPLLTGAGVIYGRHSIHDVRVRSETLKIPNLPTDLIGLTIAHVTDVHVGKFVDEKYLRRVSDMTNALNADLHLLTGDLIDLSIADLPGALDFVSSLDPKHGLVMCEGNHDLIEDPVAFYNGADRRSIPVPRNGSQSIRLPGRSTLVDVIGLPWGGQYVSAPGADGFDKAVANLKSQVQEETFPILLAHHPHAFDAAAEAGIPLTLSGHTHGGLLMLSETVGPATLLYRYWRGLYQKNNSSLFVSNGVGTWFPLRIKAQPEIVHFTLQRA